MEPDPPFEEPAPPADHDFRDALPEGPAHRRGAGLNPGNRFEDQRVHLEGEHLDRRVLERQWEGEDPATRKPVRVPLTIYADATRTLINRVAPTSDVPFDWTVNPYRGCEHGCIYCFARPYHEYLGFSCGLDFETKLVAKHDAPQMLRRELAHRSWKGEPIVMSAITDVYQPIDRDLELTRGCLEVMAEAHQPVSTMTKNTGVMRDADLWQKLAKVNAGRVIVTLVTLDEELAGKLEPRASPPVARLRVIRELTHAGIPVSVNVAPVIPGLTDHEVPAILQAVADAGARRAAWVLLRLPYQVKDLFLDWLERNVHPDRARKVESLIRQARGGKLYDAGRPQKRRRQTSHPHHASPRTRLDNRTSDLVATRDVDGRNAVNAGRRDGGASGGGGVVGGASGGHDRRRGEGHHAYQLKQVFDVYCRKYSLNRDIRPLSSKHFRRPSLHGQTHLFGPHA
ncbi:MAG: PA0069 family radical SAM protein [Planctomycetota bacterium]